MSEADPYIGKILVRNLIGNGQKNISKKELLMTPFLEGGANYCTKFHSINLFCTASSISFENLGIDFLIALVVYLIVTI